MKTTCVSVLSYKLIFIVGFIHMAGTIQHSPVQPHNSFTRQESTVEKPKITAVFQRFEENAPTLVKLLQVICEAILAILWIVDLILNFMLRISDEVISFCTNMCTKSFGLLLYIVKILEALGFGVKFMLEVNYVIFSKIFNAIGRIRGGLKDAYVLLKITINDLTEQVFESSVMVIEGMGNMFLNGCNHTWLGIQNISLILTQSIHPPFGLAAMNVDLVGSLLTTGLEFFIQSVKMLSLMVRDGCITIITKTCNEVCKVGASFSKIVDACIFVTNEIIVCLVYIFDVMKWTLYFPVTLASNISHMLVHSWKAFVDYVCHIDAAVKNFIYSTITQTCTILTSMASAIITRSLTMLQSIHRGLSTLTFQFVEVLQTVYLAILLLCAVCIVFYWHKEIRSKISSSIEVIQRVHVFKIENNDNEIVNTQQEIPRPRLIQELESELDRHLCVICQDNVKNVLLLPCRHVCICQTCLQRATHEHGYLQKCPLCRANVDSTLEIFI